MASSCTIDWKAAYGFRLYGTFTRYGPANPYESYDTIQFKGTLTYPSTDEYPNGSFTLQIGNSNDIFSYSNYWITSGELTSSSGTQTLDFTLQSNYYGFDIDKDLYCLLDVGYEYYYDDGTYGGYFSDRYDYLIPKLYIKPSISEECTVTNVTYDSACVGVNIISTGGGISEYKVSYKKTSESNYTEVIVDGPTYILKNLEHDTEYNVIFTVTNNEGSSSCEGNFKTFIKYDDSMVFLSVDPYTTYEADVIIHLIGNVNDVDGFTYELTCDGTIVKTASLSNNDLYSLKLKELSSSTSYTLSVTLSFYHTLEVIKTVDFKTPDFDLIQKYLTASSVCYSMENVNDNKWDTKHIQIRVNAPGDDIVFETFDGFIEFDKLKQKTDYVVVAQCLNSSDGAQGEKKFDYFTPLFENILNIFFSNKGSEFRSVPIWLHKKGSPSYDFYQINDSIKIIK